jgi:hypothetical protein
MQDNSSDIALSNHGNKEKEPQTCSEHTPKYQTPSKNERLTIQPELNTQNIKTIPADKLNYQADAETLNQPTNNKILPDSGPKLKFGSGGSTKDTLFNSSQHMMSSKKAILQKQSSIFMHTPKNKISQNENLLFQQAIKISNIP